MGKNPSMIFKDLYKSAKNKHSVSKKEELTGIERTIYDMSVRDGFYYVPYNEAIRLFLMEGYSEQRAVKHLKQWSDYELAWPVRQNGYKLLALGGMN